ncbi:DNA-directed RNA polymerase II subunit RPB2 [Marasmius tenuissimus]|nr:DNA-directed RNA polymerase II subunit RPB2 [Marasmius tenuissimus]
MFDRDILGTYCYDTQDIQTMEALDIDTGFVVQDREVALDFVGICGTTVGLSRERRICYTQEILLKETLPRIAVAEDSESKKA